MSKRNKSGTVTMGPAMQSALIRGLISQIEEAQAAHWLAANAVAKLQADLATVRNGEWPS